MVLPVPHGPAPGARASAARTADAHLRAALDRLARAEGSAVLCFARIQSETLYRELGFSSIHHYARAGLGFSEGKTRQFVRLAEAIDRLPGLRAALAEGRLGWTKARVLLGVATPGTEARWLELAARLGRRELEARAVEARAAAKARRRARLVEAAGQREMVLQGAGADLSAGRSAAVAGGVLRLPCESAKDQGATATALAPEPAGEPAPESALEPAPAPAPLPPAPELPVPASLPFTPVQRARYEGLLERIRKVARPRSRLAPRRASNVDMVLAGLALLAEAVEAESRAVEGAEKHEGAANVPAGAPATSPLASASAAPAAVVSAPATAPTPPPDTRVSSATNYQIIIYKCEVCTAAAVKVRGELEPIDRVTVETAGCDARVFDGRRNRATIPPSIRRQVLSRDRHRCRMPGCGSGQFLEVHHLVPREQGGGNEPENLITLCSACHRLAHERPEAVRRLLASRRE